MDIKSLLSAPDAPERPTNGASSQPHSPTPATASNPASNASSPASRTRRRQHTLVQQAVTASTVQQLQAAVHDHHAQQHAPTSAATASASASASPRPLHTLGRNAYSTTSLSSRAQYAKPEPAPAPLVQRHSASSMDTLADLATMQHYHNTAARHNSVSSRGHDLVSPQRSPSISLSRLHSEAPTPASPSALRKGSVVEHPMAEGPVPVMQQRPIDPSVLSGEDAARVADLTKQLADNSYSYTAHVELIDTLHRGLVAHVFPASASGGGDGNDNDNGTAGGEPGAYPLLQDLRQARAAMDSRFACGEDIWLTWLHDEVMVARSTEDRIAVMELCQRAVQEEVGSTALWRFYGDWMFLLHRTAFELRSDYDANSLESHALTGPVLRANAWSHDDRIVGREVFGWDHMLNVWQQAVAATSWHIPDSSLVWDAYIEILLSELRARPSPGKVGHIRQLFHDRLRQPHLSWDDTFAAFSHFVSSYDAAAYEDTMVATTQKCAKVLKALGERRAAEAKLQRAVAAADRDAEWTIMSEYLAREFGSHRQRSAPHFSLDLLLSLCQRCTLRFPTDADFWEDYMDLLVEQPAGGNAHMIPVAYRATRHVPWSGNLWSKRLACLEVANKSFDELEGVKHMATSTGLLEEVGSMDELIKVYSAWCGYLRRRAFSSASGEDERDVAEVAIRSAIENVKEVGLKRYGRDFKGDPRFRIERIYFKFMAQTGAFDEARKFWAELTQTHGDQYEFWERYYLWEMVVWPLELSEARHDVKLQRAPHHATAVLHRAIARPSLDWPEKMLDQYQHHCSQHETVEKMQEAYAECRRRLKDVTRRRANQAAETARLEQQQQQQQQQRQQQEAVAWQGGAQQAAQSETASLQADAHPAAGKRKRSDAQAAEDGETKRLKSESDGGQSGTVDAASEAKRDREHTTVVVRDLPAGVDEVKVKRFFQDCGHILSIKVTEADPPLSSVATIEFETREDVLAAQTKSLKQFDGATIQVQVGTGAILYVTNYAPEADEKYMHDLFGTFGEIVDVRFPSLRTNTHRRFCYVQFASPEQAQKATQLDGKALGKGLKLTAKISDPSKKQDRSGAAEEGREVFVGQFDYNASENDARALFESYGKIQGVRIPRKINGSSKGIAFVVFATKEEAEAALAVNLQEFKGRLLQVKLSNARDKGAKLQSTTVFAPSPSADPESLPDAHASKDPSHNYRERSLALLDLPDTVNDARVRALCEQHGEVRKIVLRPDHGGAIVEFAQVSQVGKASMALDGSEIAPGQRIRVGQVQELLRHNVAQLDASKSTASTSAAPRKPFGGMPVSRPAGPGPGARRGGKRGLGSARSTAPAAAPVTAASDAQPGANDGDSKAADQATSADSAQSKTQDDFRALLAKAGPAQ